jgi:pimeloyl-ACP methyl ester carboxylesterase
MMLRRDIAYRGDRIHLQSSGSGAPLVFLRGFDVAFRNDKFLEELATRYEIIVPDHPGFGRSDSPDWLKGMGDAAYFYLDLLGLLGLGSVHLVGASLGGWIAAEMAVRNVTNIRSLTLIGPAGVRKRDVAIGDPFIRSPDQSARAMFADGAFAAQVRCPVETDEEIDLHLKNSIGLARLGWQPRLASPELQRWLHRIRVPTCLVWGSVDKIMPLEHSAAWLGAIDDARLTVIEGAGHLPHIEAPQKAAAAVTSFIQGCA